jgi:ABC-type transport system involved in cytochrome c biogenesis permease subunit
MPLLIASFAFYLFSLSKRQLLYAGLILQIAYLIKRGIELERLPLVGPHDTLIFLSVSMVAFSIIFIPRIQSNFQTIISLFALFFTTFSLISKPHNTPLPPVLKTIWFELHVVLAFLSYGLFAIAAAIGIFSLKRQERPFDLLQYKSTLIGYCFFSLSMIFGGIWAYLAWGTYWLWTPKELWTTILWIFYSLYIHARLMKWWQGKPQAVLSIAGFAIVMLTYLGVSLLMKSSHSF